MQEALGDWRYMEKLKYLNLAEDEIEAMQRIILLKRSKCNPDNCPCL
jgi:hypothetical protein